VQFLLPGGQSLVLDCHHAATIKETKEESYLLKTPLGYLSDENLKLYPD
jgi:hypothetical protein